MFSKIAAAVMAIFIAGTVAYPVLAKKDDDWKERGRGIGSLISSFQKEKDEKEYSIGNGLFKGNTAFQSAHSTYRQAVKQAETAYKEKVKNAHKSFVAVIKTAKGDQSKILSGYKAYLAETLAASKQRSAAKEAALQQLIDALSSISVNKAPIANSQNVALNEDTPKAIVLAGSDPEGSSLTFAVAVNPAHGTLSGTIPNLTYTPNANYNGTDSFTFKVNDGSLDSPAATISLTIAPVNDAPVANAQSVTTQKNASKAIALTGTDIENSTLTFTVVSNPLHGTLSGSAPAVTYIPNNDFTGNDSFTFKVNDGNLDSSTAIVSLTVSP